MKTISPSIISGLILLLGIAIASTVGSRTRAEPAEQAIAAHCAKIHVMLETYAAQLAGAEGSTTRAAAADAFGGNYGILPLADEIALCHPTRPVDLTQRNGCWLAWLTHETPQRTELAYQCLAQIARHAADAIAPDVETP